MLRFTSSPLAALIGLVLLTALTGCCRFRRDASRQAVPMPADVANRFAYERKDRFETKEEELSTTRHYSIRQVDFGIGEGNLRSNWTIRLSYYLPKTDGPHPVVLLLPISGGDYFLEEYFARYFARHRLACLIVHREKIKKSEELLENLDPLLHQTVINHRHVIDWIETRPELDAGRIGVLGTSMGGIKGALLAPVEPRIRAAVLGLTGGDLPYILTQSSEPGVKRRRQRLLEKHDLDLKGLHEHLKSAIKLDPLSVAPYVDNEKVLLILAACDTVVPYPKGKELRHAMGRPETAVVLAGHYSALLYLPYIQRAAYKFFKRKFDL